VQCSELYIGAKDMNAKLVVQSTEAAKKVITTNVPKTDGTRNFVGTIDFHAHGNANGVDYMPCNMDRTLDF
tara:strand:- start:95 stop:307 length:213 start_codon:yes stop_codon:yes gene_type:complete